MRTKVTNWLSIAAVVVAVTIGCTGVLQQVANEASTGGGNGDISGGFARIDSAFSDAPVSPGGTGGEAIPLTGAEDVDLEAEETRSFFTAFQIDPISEDTAGPKIVTSADIDQDGLLDLLTGWNQSQPVQLHLQRRDADGNISFRTVTLAGTSPIGIIAGIEVGQINDDGWLDVVILSKATGGAALCPKVPPAVVSVLEGEIVVLFSPGSAGLIPDGDQWTEMILSNPFIRDRIGTSGVPWIHNQFPGNEDGDLDGIKAMPELGGFTALVVGNMDGVPGDDIVVALNTAECEELGQKPAVNTVDLWTNPGPGLASIPDQWGTPLPSAPASRVPVSLMTNLPQIRDIELLDVDNDGDLDVVVANSNALSRNVSWIRNPLIPHTVGGPSGLTEVVNGISDGWRFVATGWERRPVGQMDTGADNLTIGDVDGDGFDDVVVRSTFGVVQWFRRPTAVPIEPEFPPNDPVPNRFNFPWQVFTMTEFPSDSPEAVAVGDVTGDGQVELVIAAGGAAFWFDGSVADSVFDPWSPNTIIQDSAEDMVAGGGTAAAPGAGVGVGVTDTSTVINTLLIVDVDGDGRNDIIGTLDRRSGSGVSDDRIVWYRNVRTEEDDLVVAEEESQ